MNARPLQLWLAVLTSGLAAACATVSPELRFDSPPHTLAASDAAVASATAWRSSGLLQEPAVPEAPAQRAGDEGWAFLLKPYLFAYGLKGSVGTGRSASDIDADFDDLFDKLNVGGMLQFEVSPPRSNWTFLADLMFAQVEAEGQTPGPVGVDVDAKIDQFIGELSAAYEVIDEGRLEVVGGVRYWRISGELEADLPGGPESADARGDWFDPLVGARSRLELGSSFDLMLRGDLGGFGVGSDLAYNLAVELGWSLSKTFQVALGYRQVYVDYEDDATYDVTQAGPTLGLAIRL